MEEQGVTDATREKVRELMKDPEVVALYHLKKNSIGMCSNWKQIEYSFFEAVADVAGDPAVDVKEKLRKECEFLEDERCPAASSTLSRLLGVGKLPAGVDPRSGDGRLLRTENGVEIRAAGVEWKRDDGVFVGNPHREFGSSIYHRDFVSQLDKEEVRKSLEGQKLYVTPGDVKDALWLIHEFGIRKGEHITQDGWRQRFQRGAARGMSVSLAGVVLKISVGDRPGDLGNLSRALPCCALENFHRLAQELLPLPMPRFDEEEKSLELRVQNVLADGHEVKAQDWAELSKESIKLGCKFWTWLQCLVINFLYCNSVPGRMLSEGMLHPRHGSPAQQQAVARLEKLSKKWLEDDCEGAVVADTWEKAAEELGDMYTGPNLGKSFPLTLAAILPTTPGAGEAARIPLVDVVSEGVKPYVESPADLRIPDEELISPRTTAAVQVESQEEWDKIVSHLVDAGMLEREVEAEVLRYHDTPVRNGAFGVHKNWVLQSDGTWLRTLRLIINMIPGNSFQKRMPVRASERMGYAPLWGNLYLHSDEIIVCAAEDQRHCFHIYRPGYAWRSFFSLSRKASGECFKDGKSERSFPRVKSAPMGWNNVVDFIQDGFENMAKMAGLAPNQVIRMGEPSPLEPLKTPRSFFSFYVDNFDQLKIIWRTDRGLLEGTPTEEQLRLRETMEELTVGRDPKKSAESAVTWNSLGAEVAGDEGWVGSARSFRKALLSANFGLVAGDEVRTDSPNLLSIVSKNVHSVQYCRQLSCCLDQLFVELNEPVPKLLSERARDELLLLSCALPMHWMDLKLKVSGKVYATDASPDGGGACVTTGLSPWGSARLQSMSHECDGVEGAATQKALVVECFSGIGGLKQALDLLGYEPAGVVAIDSSPDCQKVYKQHCRHVLMYTDIQKITKEQVFEWRKKFPRVTRVILGGGWPCVNHSVLNSRRQGAVAATSMLLDDMLQIREWLLEASDATRLAPWKVVEFFENVVMDDQDFSAQVKKIGFTPYFLEAAQLGRCRRPRLYWLRGVDLIPGDDLKVRSKASLRDHEYLVKEIRLDTERPPLDWFLAEGATKLAEPEDAFATFTRPIPRQQPPDQPAGLESASEKAKKRWKGDAYRLAPYQYEDRNMVIDKNGPRRLMPEEQLRMMGFQSSHLATKARLSADVRGQMVGNSFSAIAVARLLAGLVVTAEQCKRKDVTLLIWQVWKEKEERVKKEDKPWKVRFASVAAGAPGVVSLLDKFLPSPVAPLRSFIDPQNWLTDEEMLTYLLARNGTHRNAEIRVDLGMPYSVGELCRQSVDPTHWCWKVLMSYTWKEKGQHINVLELVAVLDVLRRQGRDQKFHNQRLVTLVDNQVAVSSLSKGRSSAKALQGPLRRISAVCLAAHFRLCLAWVKSKWNPADGPSRWAARRKKRDA
jgi:site-specific DNA-cytosine methylase